jgi:hypothetical protein
VHGERVHVRRPERDEPADQVGPADREHLGHAAAAALADHDGALALLGHQALESLLEALMSGAGAADVRAHPRP